MGAWTFWHPNGQKQEEGHYTDGKRVGAWTIGTRTAKKRRKAISRTEGERAHGPFGTQTARSHSRANFENSEKVGAWTHWDDSGPKQEESHYVNGVRENADVQQR